MKDLQESDNITHIESPMELDTGYVKVKELYGDIGGHENGHNEHSTELLGTRFLKVDYFMVLNSH